MTAGPGHPAATAGCGTGRTLRAGKLGRHGRSRGSAHRSGRCRPQRRGDARARPRPAADGGGQGRRLRARHDSRGAGGVAGGAQWLGVVHEHEALALRQAGITTRVLTLLGVPGAAHEAAIREDVDLTVDAVPLLHEIAAAATRAGRPARVHLKVDTGMARGGATPASWAGAGGWPPGPPRPPGTSRLRGYGPIWPARTYPGIHPSRPAGPVHRGGRAGRSPGSPARGAPPGQHRGGPATSRGPGSTWSARAARSTGWPPFPGARRTGSARP